MAEALEFTDNSTVKTAPDRYVTITVDTAKVLKSWRQSLFAYEWMTPDGKLKQTGDLSATEQPKRAAIEERIKKGEALEKPVLGIGLLDNVEIGVGRAVFLTLAAHGVQKIPVHIPKSNRDEFAKFIG